MKQRNITTLLILLILPFLLGAQNKQITGKVTAFKNIPLKKVSILSNDGNLLASSDANGIFTFSCDPKEKIVVQAAGFNSKKLKASKLNEKDSLFVDLKYKKSDENFETATAAGHISRDELTHAISIMEAGPDYSSYKDILEVIEGRVTGVTIYNNQINIRGNATLNQGSVPALLLIDGTIVEFPVFVSLPTQNIKSIKVLKGASASAQYGSRGMGGAILVTTKGNQ